MTRRAHGRTIRRRPYPKRPPPVTLIVRGVVFHSHLEALFYEQVLQAGLPCPETQYKVVPLAKWAFDFAWPKYRLAAEIDGGIWLTTTNRRTGKRRSGGHANPVQIIKDNTKRNAARALGWIVFQFETNSVEQEVALQLTRDIFARFLRRK